MRAWTALAVACAVGCARTGLDDVDASQASWAHDAMQDAANTSDDVADGDGGPFCSTPLDFDAGEPTTLSDVRLAAWCNARPRLIEWTCGGVIALVVGDGGDCNREYLFDASSQRLVAIVQGCNGSEGCFMGDPSFTPPTDCWSGNVAFGVTDVCVEAGLADEQPDGAAASCSSDAQCPTGYVCGYFTNTPCASIGSCVYGDFANDPLCSPTTYCACDGTETQACEGLTGGFALKPVPTRGLLHVCGDVDSAVK